MLSLMVPAIICLATMWVCIQAWRCRTVDTCDDNGCGHTISYQSHPYKKIPRFKQAYHNWKETHAVGWDDHGKLLTCAELNGARLHGIHMRFVDGVLERAVTYDNDVLIGEYWVVTSPHSYARGHYINGAQVGEQQEHQYGQLITHRYITNNGVYDLMGAGDEYKLLLVLQHGMPLLSESFTINQEWKRIVNET